MSITTNKFILVTVLFLLAYLFLTPQITTKLMAALPANISFSCDWENTIVGPGCWYRAQIMANDRFQRVTSPVRKGNYAVRVEVRPGDNPINSTGERSEVALMLDQNGNQIWETEASGTQFYGFSVLLPTDWKTTSGTGNHWGLIFQLHGPDILAASPAFGIEAKQDRFRLDMEVGDLARTSNLYNYYAFSDESLNLGHWVDFVIKIKFAKDATGSVDIWRRNEGVTDFTQVLSVNNVPTLQYSSNINGGAVSSHYWKTGFYRNIDTSLTNVLYLDGTTRGTSFDAVVAEAFPIPSPTYVPGDINRDRIVNIQDYTLLSNAFGTSNTAADVNSDGIVNVQDYTLLSNNFGKTS